jgi:uncharacterized protein (TIGR02284 family)
MSNNSEHISLLNDLIETLKDGQAGFKAAADDIDSSEIRTLFNGFVLQRSEFAGELQALVQSLGESDPQTSGSVAGALHRGWIDLKAALTSKDEHAILAECERGEDSAVAHYREVLDTDDLPSNVREVVSQQFVEIKAAHDQVRDLRDSLVTK